MSQTSITSYYNSRKRAATDDLITSKSKVPHVERHHETLTFPRKIQLSKKCDHLNTDIQLAALSTDTKDVAVGKPTTVTNNDAKEINSSTSKDHPQAKTVFAKKSSTSNIAKTQNPALAQPTSSARKELSLGDIRKRLAGSSRLSELKANAERISKGIQQLKASEEKNLKEFKSIDVEIPTSPNQKSQLPSEFLSPKKQAPTPQETALISPRKVFVSPVKSPNKVPAYIRYAALATSSNKLPLPHHYRFLSELFRGMETVVALLHNRNEKITFAKLKPSIQEMLKRSFNEKHLAQIKQLVPDFYNYQMEKVKNFSNSSYKEAFELVITPNLPHGIKIMNPTVLLERRRYFYDALLSLVKKHHARYLLTLEPPMVVPDDKLARWHPKFEIEECPEVESAKLPDMPNVEKLSSAKDVLAKARELFKCNTKMERALEKLAQAKARGLTEEEKAATGINEIKSITSYNSSTQTGQSSPSTSSVTLLNPALRNLPASLLEKVKAKQAAKALEAMTRSSDYQQKYLVYSGLPDLARTLRNIFVTERKNVLALNIILSKLESSFKANISTSDLQRDIKALTIEVPEWIQLHEIRNNTYLKLDKNADLKKITSKLEELASNYKN